MNKLDSNRENLRKFLFRSLSDQRWDYRTLDGLCKELKVDRKVLLELINSTPEIRKSVMTDSKGRALFTLKNRKSLIGDYLTAFRAINSSKYGDTK